MLSFDYTPMVGPRTANLRVTIIICSTPVRGVPYRFTIQSLSHTKSQIKWTLFLPLAGMGLFVVFYIVAARMYPGGSWADPGQEGFSWRHNYLCDLLDTLAVNGQLNPGRYWARTSLGVLCAGLAILWYQLPRLLDAAPGLKRMVRISSVAAFVTTAFLSAGNHDLTVRIAGLFGLVALLSAVVGLWRNGRRGMSVFGMWCLGIFLLNYAIYETGSFIGALPLIQKITFGSFLGWFAWMNVALLRLPKPCEGPKLRENSIKIS